MKKSIIMANKLGMMSLLWLSLSLFSDGKESHPFISLIFVLVISLLATEVETATHHIDLLFIMTKEMRLVNEKKRSEVVNLIRLAGLFLAMNLGVIGVWIRIEEKVYLLPRDSHTDFIFLIITAFFLALYIESLFTVGKLAGIIKSHYRQRKEP